jgi:phage/plasmid-like protein (TIGR03299 family)
MSHNINEGRIFYVGEKPWHGIGQELANPATAKEAIEAARLDYQVGLVEIQTVGGIPIIGKRATVRRDTKTALGVVGEDYRIVQNVEAFGFFDTIVGEGQAIYHTAGALGQGERIWILAKLPKEMVVAKGDVVEKYLILTNSHDGKSSLRMYFSPVRVVCQNTLTMSLSDAGDGIAIRHTGNIKAKVDEARRVLGIAVKFYDKVEEVIQALASFKIDPKMVDKYFEELIFGEGKDKESTRLKNQKTDLLTLFESGRGNQLAGVRHSAWAAYNAVTEYVDHSRTVKGLKQDPTNRLKSIWFGSGAQVKARAFSGITNLVGIKV